MARGSKQTESSLVHVLDSDHSARFWQFTGSGGYLVGGEERPLAELSAERVKSSESSEDEIAKALEQFWQELREVQFSIEYEDIFGNSFTCKEDFAVEWVFVKIVL